MYTASAAASSHPAAEEQFQKTEEEIRSMNPRVLAVVLLVGTTGSAAAADANRAAELEAPTVDVGSTTPLPGIGTPIDQVPANVHAITGQDIRKQNTIDLSQYLDRNVSSVNI